MKAATIRGMYGGIFTGMLTLFTSFQVMHSWTDAGIAAAVTFSGYMVSRGMAEGIIDSNRGPTKADVGQS